MNYIIKNIDDLEKEITKSLRGKTPSASAYDIIAEADVASRAIATPVGWRVTLEDALQEAFDGKASTEIKLFPIDPGFGKTTTAAHFIGRCKRDGFPNGGSILVLVSRIKEIETYIRISGITEDDYAIITSDKATKHRGLGERQSNKARVLFTTQQMLLSRMGSGNFADVTEFHYQGKPRSLRIWDETLERAKALTVRLDALDELASPLRPIVPDFIDLVSGWVATVRPSADGSVLTVPIRFREEIEAAFGLGIKRHLPNPHTITALESLAALAGSEVEIFVTSGHGPTLVGCGNSIPDDLAPLIVLDASGSVRGTYDLWSRYGDGLVRMPAARGDYRNLLIAVHKLGCGKMNLIDPERRALLVKIARGLIDADRDEWLVIHLKEPAGKTIADEIRAAVSKPERVKSLHWGDHHGTNDYRDIKKVLVIGLMSYPPAAYRAMHMASAGLEPASISGYDCDDLKRAELMHHLLQGITRCNVRNHVGGACGSAAVYVIAAGKYDPIGVARDTFPGARVREWTPVERGLKGRASDVVVEIGKALDLSDGKPVTKKAIRDAVGISGNALGKLLGRSDVQGHLKADGVTVEYAQIRRLGNADKDGA